MLAANSYLMNRMITIAIVYGFLLGISLKLAMANNEGTVKPGNIKGVVVLYYIISYWLQGTTVI